MSKSSDEPADLILIISTLHELNLQAKNHLSDLPYFEPTRHKNNSRQLLNALYSAQVAFVIDQLERQITHLHHRIKRPVKVLDIGCGMIPYWKAFDRGLRKNEIATIQLIEKSQCVLRELEEPDNAGFKRFLDDSRVSTPVLCDFIEKQNLQENGSFLSWLFTNLSERLSDEGILMVGEFYYPDFLLASESSRSAALLRKIASHGDPPEAFVPPDEIVHAGRKAGFTLIERTRCAPLVDYDKAKKDDLIGSVLQNEDITGDDWQLLGHREYFLSAFNKLSHHEDKGLDFSNSALISELESHLSKSLGDLNERFSTSFEGIEEGSLSQDQVVSAMDSLLASSNPKHFCSLRSLAGQVFNAIARFKLRSYGSLDESLTLWLSVSSRLLAKASQVEGTGYERFDPSFCEDNDTMYHGFHFCKSYRAEAEFSAVNPDPPSIEWSNLAFNLLLSPRDCGLHANGIFVPIQGPSIHAAIVDASNSHISNLPKSVLAVCVPEGEADRIHFLDELDRRRSTRDHPTWVWNSEETDRFRSGASFSDALQEAVEGFDVYITSEKPQGWNDQLYATLRTSMLSVYLDFLFLGRNLKDGSNVQDLLQEFGEQWLNSSSVIFVDSYELALEYFEGSEPKCILPEFYKEQIEKAVNRSADIAKKNDTTLRLPLTWLTSSVSSPGAHNVVSTLISYSNELVPHDLVDMVVVRFLRPILFEYLIHEDSFYHEIVEATTRKKARQAARAAVLARNFSHIIGSHVISNPGFVESLLPAVWTFKKAAEELGRLRDMEHYNLANWCSKVEEIREDPNRGWSSYGAIKSFHSYLQGRFDFIARAVEAQTDRPEPVFWVADVLEGFFRQTAFLDTLSGDIGLRLDKFRIVLHLPKGKGQNSKKCFLGTWAPTGKEGKMSSWRHRLSWDQCNEHGNTENFEDSNVQPSDLAILVGMPGG